MRDRVKELRRVPASELRAHPQNWRTHPEAQRGALRSAIEEVGFAGALLARELPDGSLELIDGHLRAETAADESLPVLVLDVTAQEANKILLTHDPLAAMAETDGARLANLLAGTEFESQERVSDDAARIERALTRADEQPEIVIRELFQVVVDCGSEAQQQAVFERMRGEGFRCRVLTL
jgi:ParB-like chromosome segregation protein Spo0J